MYNQLATANHVWNVTNCNDYENKYMLTFIWEVTSIPASGPWNNSRTIYPFFDNISCETSFCRPYPAHSIIFKMYGLNVLCIWMKNVSFSFMQLMVIPKYVWCKYGIRHIHEFCTRKQCLQVYIQSNLPYAAIRGIHIHWPFITGGCWMHFHFWL